jgi:hypothetical protein
MYKICVGIDPIIIKWLAGLLVSLILGHIVTEELVNSLKKKSELPKLKSHSVVLGAFERLAYVLSLINGYPSFIGIWLGVKMIGRWTGGDAIGIPKSYYIDKNGKEDDYKKRELTSAAINIYLLGNLVSLLFAILGAFIIGIKK